MSKTYSFVEQLERGKAGEQIIKDYFSRWYKITDATLDQQKDEKIDFIFERDGRKMKVEVKTDDRTDKTGNLFIETWSAVEYRRYGWAYATKADIIIYYALPDTVYILERKQLQDALLRWIRQYTPINIKNHGYTTQGLAIPTEVIVDLIGSKMVRRLS